MVFPLALTGPSKIKQQRTMQAITVVRGSADTSISPKLSREVQVRLATHGWQSKSTLITVGGVGAGDPALAAPGRISPRIRALLQSAFHLDTPMGVQKRLIELGYLPAGTTSSDYGISQAIMAFQGWEGLPRDGVAGAATQTAMLTAKRPTATRPGKGKRIEVDIGKQVLLLEDGSKVLRVIHVSTGATGNTPRGNYSIIRKENPSWVPEFKIWLSVHLILHRGLRHARIPRCAGVPRIARLRTNWVAILGGRVRVRHLRNARLPALAPPRVAAVSSRCRFNGILNEASRPRNAKTAR